MTESYIIIIIVAKVRLLLTMILADIFPGSIKIMGVVFRFSKQQKFFDNGLHPHIISVTEILSILMYYWHFKTTERESFIFIFIEKYPPPCQKNLVLEILSCKIAKKQLVHRIMQTECCHLLKLLLSTFIDVLVGYQNSEPRNGLKLENMVISSFSFTVLSQRKVKYHQKLKKTLVQTARNDRKIQFKPTPSLLSYCYCFYLFVQ